MTDTYEYATELNLLLERILPAGLHGDRQFPGAQQLKIPQFAQQVLTDHRHQTARQYLPHALQSLNQYCTEHFKCSFVACSESQQDTAIQALLDQQDRYFSAVFQQLIRLALEGMLSHPRHGGNWHEQGWQWVAYQHHEPEL